MDSRDRVRQSQCITDVEYVPLRMSVIIFTLYPNSVLNAHCSISHITRFLANRIECALSPNWIHMCIEPNRWACHVTPRLYELGK